MEPTAENICTFSTFSSQLWSSLLVPFEALDTLVLVSGLYHAASFIVSLRIVMFSSNICILFISPARVCQPSPSNHRHDSRRQSKPQPLCLCQPNVSHLHSLPRGDAALAARRYPQVPTDQPGHAENFQDQQKRSGKLHDQSGKQPRLGHLQLFHKRQM